MARRSPARAVRRRTHTEHALEDAEQGFRSGNGVSPLMRSTAGYEDKVSGSLMATVSLAVINSASV